MSMTVRLPLRVRFRRLEGMPCMKALDPSPGVQLHVLAGRLTPVDAWLDLELTGDRDALARAVEGFRLRGITVEMARPLRGCNTGTA